MVVKYSKKFPYAPYLNEDIGFEMESGDNTQANAMETLNYLKQIAEAFHKENNPGLYVTVNPEYVNSIPQGQQPLQSIDPKAKDLKEIIQDCTSIEDLQELKNESERLGLLAEYNTKREKLLQ